MAGITGQGTTYGLPNYTGELFEVSRADTPFLSAIGGLTGGESTSSTEFEWQTYDLRDATVNNVALEGANAPTAAERVRANVTNVVEIHQEAIEVSYTKMGATGSRAGANVDGSNPVTDEMAWQSEQALKQVAMDVELSFINGTYQKPANNSTARQTRGLIAAAGTSRSGGGDLVELATSAASDDIFDTSAAHGFFAGDQVIFTELTGGGTGAPVVGTTYYVLSANLASQTFQVSATPGGTAVNFGSNITAGKVRKLKALTEAGLLDFLQVIWESGGIRETETATVIVNGWLKRQLSKILITDKGYAEATRNVGGVNLQTVETDFGRLNLMLHPRMPKHKMLVASLEQCAPVFLEIPGKGRLFVEPLGKSGAAEKWQMYGEVGLKYGNPNAHGVLADLATIVPPTS